MGRFSNMVDKAREKSGPVSARPPAAAPKVEPIVPVPQQPAQKPVVPAAPAPVAAPAPAPKAEPAPAQVPVAPPASPAPVALPPVPSPAPAAPAVQSAPAPVSSAPVLPPIPSAAPAPQAAPAGPSEEDDGVTPVVSGDVLSVVPVPSVSQGQEPELDLLTLLPAEVPSGHAPAEPVHSEADALSLPPATPSMQPAQPEQRRRVPGTLAFVNGGDNGLIALGYKLQYRGNPGDDSCIFSLIVKGKEWPELITLKLDTPKKVDIPTKDGHVSLSLTLKGKNDIGQIQVDYVMEGGVEAVTGIKEGFRKTGGVFRSAGRKLYQHLDSVVSVAFAAGLLACGLSMDWIRNDLGRLYPYAVATVPGIITGLAIWGGFKKEQNIRKEMEASD